MHSISPWKSSIGLFKTYAAGGFKFGQYYMMQKHGKWLQPWQMGTHLGVLSKSYPMNINMTGFRWLSQIFVSLVLGLKWLKDIPI